jgi:uncharacterized protein (DUF362 family)
MKHDKHKNETNPLDEMNLSRRHFIAAVGLTTAGLFLGSSCKKDSPTAPKKNKVIPPGNAIVAVGSINNYDRTKTKAFFVDMLDKLGGISDIVKTGAIVAIKINLTGGSGSAKSYSAPACESYWTHPESVLALGECIKDAGASKIYIVESIYDPESYTDFGFVEVANRLGATLVDLNDPSPYDDFMDAPVPNYQVYRTVKHHQLLHEVDTFVSLAKAKQHIGAGQTHSMKNLVGTIPASYYAIGGTAHRSGIHARGNPNLVRTVLDLNRARPIHLGVVDAVKTTLGGEGPWINTMRPKSFNKYIMSKDPVACDAISVQTIGFDPMAADNSTTFPDTDNYLKIAEDTGIGMHDVSKISVV